MTRMREMYVRHGIIEHERTHGYGTCIADYTAILGQPINQLGINGDEGLVFRLADGRELWVMIPDDLSTEEIPSDLDTAFALADD